MTSNEILELTQRLLDAIAQGNWEEYTTLCSSDLTAFEPEACGQLVEGMPFHKYYFDGQAFGKIQTTIASPRVRMLGDDAAVIAYTRLNQYVDSEGRFRTAAFEETRVWQRIGDAWQHVHFHRSIGTSGS